MPHQTSSDLLPDSATSGSLVPVLVRSIFGGALMGLANLVPGISGGTMLLAAGIYPRFIRAIGELTTLTFRKVSVLTLAGVVGAALLAIAAMAGTIKDLVVDHRWIMYSIFIGLTLGGIPLVWRLIGQNKTRGMWTGAVVGFIGMALIALIQMQGGGSANRDGIVFLFLAGTAGAAAMILPGISGGYLLLLLGAYVPILAGIDAFKDALKGLQFDILFQVGLQVILPVGLGVIIGVLAVSNLLRWLLDRYEPATLGVLLGLLLGAVAGLWPFQQGVAPFPGDSIKGQTVQVDAGGKLYLAETNQPLKTDDYPTVFFRPTPAQIGGSLGLILAGFLTTLLVDRLGREKQRPSGYIALQP
ncbi:MAG: hypothetical protein A2498_14430 [Lentisphaerae bacterium RIFOXYC12_FULL_60_16]|nr:MAG: hypothetical protein A2498_14430 [Lentisphaerae bacterium RIFOXYC12_FULL_60_16]OGV69984.1 MAG: hypothetical protein A2269_06180 [Lentisphaerae bacterium RIFOXYA12_FULL_60_10]OGV86641.1 MAG: hypothetical protein A2340_02000 [Lentisphaerae bacterium RIFOXYB12_FULL_60_10]